MTTRQLPEKEQFGSGSEMDVEIENLDALLAPPSRILRPENGGFPSLPEVPHLVHAKKSKRMPPLILRVDSAGTGWSPSVSSKSSNQ